MHSMLLQGQLAQLHINFGVHLRKYFGVSKDNPSNNSDA